MGEEQSLSVKDHYSDRRFAHRVNHKRTSSHLHGWPQGARALRPRGSLEEYDSRRNPSACLAMCELGRETLFR